MEDVFINVDSQYRNTDINPSESQYTYNLETPLKNIISVRLASIEISNGINIISTTNNNNYFTIYLPNKTNDPDGWTITLPDGLYQGTDQFSTSINKVFNSLFNNWYVLQGYQFRNSYFAQKYLYIFYLNSDIIVQFDFNASNEPASLATPLTISAGWTSLYGLVIQITNYITNKYNERKSYLVNDPILKKAEYIKNNPSDPNANNFIYTPPMPIVLDNGNFTMYSFNVNVFDRRFRSDVNNVIPGPGQDCVRIDPIINPNTPDGSFTYNNNDLQTNLSSLKNNIYRIYISDIVAFNVSYIPSPTNGILDNLASSNYIIPPGYLLAGQMLTSSATSYINNSINISDLYTVSVYNLSMNVNPNSLFISVTNSFSSNNNPLNLIGQSAKPFLYYYVSDTVQTWDAVDTSGKPFNTLDNLLSSKTLFSQGFITRQQFDDPTYVPTLIKDIPSFQIDFTTNSKSGYNISNLSYPSIGYYLGYRKNLGSFLLSPTDNNTTTLSLVATKLPNTNGSTYLFLRINDWGVFDFAGLKTYAKVLLPSAITNTSYGQYVVGNSTINGIFTFRQPQNIKRLDVELLDYLGNVVNMNGIDWSMTLQFNEEYNSNNKVMIERNNLVFRNIPVKK